MVVDTGLGRRPHRGTGRRTAATHILTAGRPARVVVLCSKRAPWSGASARLRGASSALTVVGVMTTESDCIDVDMRERGIPVVCRDIHAFYAERAAKLTRNWRCVRRTMPERSMVSHLHARSVLLDGYLYPPTSSVL